MADINFGILDTQSPAKIGNAFIRSPEQQNANMLQAMQMQGFVNQNELAQSQLRTARRAEEGQALLGQAYAGTNFGTGGTAGGMAGGAGQSPYPSMRESIVKKLLGTPSAYLIPSELAKLTEMEHKETTNREAQGKVEKQARDAVDYTLKQFQTEVPRVTDAAGVERYTRATYRDKLLGPIVSRFKTEDQAVADAVNLFNSPGGANKWATQNMGMSADKLVDLLKTTTRTTNLGNVSRAETEDFFGNKVGMPVDTPIGAAPGTAPAIRQANIAEARARDEGILVGGMPAGALVVPQASNMRPPAPVVNGLIGGQQTAASVGGRGPSPREIREARAKGFNFNPDGTMTRISGGPADKANVERTPVQETRFRKDLATDFNTVTATTQGMQDVIDSITDVRNSPGLGGATGIQGMIYSIPGSNAAAAETNLTNLKGKVTSLGQVLASASGKIGPMAVQEWTIVRDMVAALDKAVSKGETITRDELVKIEFAAKNIADRVKTKFEGQYGDELPNYPSFAVIPEPKSRVSGAIAPAAVTAPAGAGKPSLDSIFGKKNP